MVQVRKPCPRGLAATCLLTSVFSAAMIVPGSHRYGHRPPPEVQEEHPPGAEHLEVPAGTTIIVRQQHLFCACLRFFLV